MTSEEMRNAYWNHYQRTLRGGNSLLIQVAHKLYIWSTQRYYNEAGIARRV